MSRFNLFARLRRAFREHLVWQRSLLAAQVEVRDEIRSIHQVLDAMRAIQVEVRDEIWLNRWARLYDAVTAADGRYADPLTLARYNASVYSQVGEDGIVAEIFRRIGFRDRTFLEIGVGDGRENTTRFLMEMGWRGTWIEADESNATAARELMHDFVTKGRLTVVHAVVTAENVNNLLDKAGVPTAFDYLSIDVDQNTSHVWKQVNRYARVACIEYNASLPPLLAISVPYHAERFWDGSSWYGASLKALERIGSEKNLSLVGCDLKGANAFFVATDEAIGRFREPFDAQTHYQPMIWRHPTPQTPRSWVLED